MFPLEEGVWGNRGSPIVPHALIPDDQRHRTAAEGYAALGMYLDADAELQKWARSPRSTP